MVHKLGSWQERALHTQKTQQHTQSACNECTGGSVDSNMHTVHHTFETLHKYHMQLAQEGRGGLRRAGQLREYRDVRQ